MDFPLIITFLVLVFVLVILITNKAPADATMVFAMLILLITGVLDIKSALSGFSNEGVLTIGVLYVVVAGLRESGVIALVSQSLFGFPQKYSGALLRVMLPASLLSAFLNNTPVVAMLIPAIKEWAGKINIPISKFLLPLSYASILGGTCTLIGTSTNLVIAGMLKEYDSSLVLSMFSITPVGVVILVSGLTTIFFTSNILLPGKMTDQREIESTDEYSVAMSLSKNSPLAGKTIEKAGLRNLQYSYLAEIERNKYILPAVSSDTYIEKNDILVFYGQPEAAKELREIRGLEPAEEQVHKLNLKENKRNLYEAVISFQYPYLNQTVKDSKFRSIYGAAILSVSRNGKKMPQKTGGITLKPGDKILLESHENFLERFKNQRDFLLISKLDSGNIPNYKKAPYAFIALVVMMLLSSLNITGLFIASSVAAFIMVVTRTISISQGRKNIDFSVLAVIASSFALGHAMQISGLSDIIASFFFALGSSNLVALVILFIITVALTENITNNAAAVIMFPIAVSISKSLQADLMPFVMTVLFAASASYLSPLGYQTNLMVFGPGGYRFRDYLRAGFPLTISTGLVTILMVPYIWPF